jgi:hypothetical protein
LAASFTWRHLTGWLMMKVSKHCLVQGMSPSIEQNHMCVASSCM